MKSEVLLLAVIATVAVVLNLSFILLIEVNKTGSTQDKLSIVFTGYDPLDVFDEKVLQPDKSRQVGDIDKLVSVDVKIEKPKEEGYDIVFIENTNYAEVYKDGKQVDLLIIDYPGFGTNIVNEQELIEKIKFSYERRDQKVRGQILDYERFDVDIEQSFYNQYPSRFQDFFNKFALRLNKLEELTGWSAEENSNDGDKLHIYVYPESGTSCVWGVSSVTYSEFDIYFQEGFSFGDEESTLCEYPYYVGGQEFYGNPGDLEDKWIYMWGALHETTHTIFPMRLKYNPWLSEGFAQYYGYNLFPYNYGSSYVDLNQETVDYYIENAPLYPAYDWPDYSQNDYYDGVGQEIQSSMGFDITAWMFSMLRDDYYLSWNRFHELLNNNFETLENAFVRGGSSWNSIYLDSFIIDLFTRSSTADTTTFQYDGLEGPGWGVRQWESLDWYGDLSANVVVDDNEVYTGQNINVDVTIMNNGGVDLVDVPVKVISKRGGCVQVLYEGIIPGVDKNGGSYVIPTMTFTENSRGTYNVLVEVDYSNIKVESNEENNVASEPVDFIISCTPYFDKKKWAWVYPCSPYSTKVDACYVQSENYY